MLSSGGGRILTNAHVVRDAVRLRIQRFGSAEKFPARVVATSLECDLALIEIIDVDDGFGRVSRSAVVFSGSTTYFCSSKE